MEPEERLRFFVRKAEELRERRILRDNDFSANLSLTYNAYSGYRIDTTLHDEEDLRSLLVSLRPFLSNDEVIFLNAIYNLCQLCLTSDEYRQKLIDARQDWKFSQESSGINVIIDDTNLTPEYVAKLWINGYYFHFDPDATSELERLMATDPAMIRWRFLNFIVDATRQVLYVGAIVKAALRDNHFDFTKASVQHPRRRRR